MRRPKLEEARASSRDSVQVAVLVCSNQIAASFHGALVGLDKAVYVALSGHKDQVIVQGPCCGLYWFACFGYPSWLSQLPNRYRWVHVLMMSCTEHWRSEEGMPIPHFAETDAGNCLLIGIGKPFHSTAIECSQRTINTLKHGF